MQVLKEKLQGWGLSLSHLILVGLLVLLLFFSQCSNLLGQEKEKNLLDDLDQDRLQLEEAEDDSLELEESMVQASAETAQDPQLIFVDIKGAVENPGVYEMTAYQRIEDVVDKAGGLNEHADANQVNFAKSLHDEMVIYIPLQGEEIPKQFKLADSQAENGHSDPTNISSEEEGKVNLNTASLQELMTLNGIGEKKAQAIIDYRENVGAFTSIEDIKNISGIGDKSFEKLKDDLSV